MRLAIIGTGTHASHHAIAAQTLGVDVAVVEYRAHMRDHFVAQHGLARAFASLDRLWAAGGADAICLCAPYTSHAAGCLNAGVPVLVERPFAPDADAARELWCISEQTGTPLMAAYGWRFDAGVLWLKGQIASGALGSTLHSRGAGLDAIDTARFLMGDPQPTGVYAHFNADEPECSGNDAGIIVVTWDTGATSVIESGPRQSQASNPDGATLVCGTRGYGRSVPAHSQFFDADGTVQVNRAAGERCDEAMYLAQMAHFIECAVRAEQPSVNGAHGYLNMCILDAAYASARIGRVVEL